ncbi:MAG: hypothetical protein RLP02_32865 [Coleofasciculus sp. C2-GNP5-27]
MALITDFNSTEDVIQLSGSENNYSLGAVPNSLTELFPSLDGIAIYQNGSGNSQAELIGIMYGYEVTDFSSGFEFV